MPDVTLNLTVDEANLILESLGNQPFVRVHDLVYKIKSQAQAQLTPATPAPSPEPAPQP